MLLFRPTPARLARPWRNLLLRLFGASIGRAYLHPSVRVWAPWLLAVGNDVYVDERTYLYNPFGIRLADRITVSSGTFLCGASHDYTLPTYPLIGGLIQVDEDVWIAADAFIAPGIHIPPGVVVGARAVVVRNPEPWTVVAGNPARPIKVRALTVPSESPHIGAAPHS